MSRSDSAGRSGRRRARRGRTGRRHRDTAPQEALPDDGYDDGYEEYGDDRADDGAYRDSYSGDGTAAPADGDGDRYGGDRYEDSYDDDSYDGGAYGDGGDEDAEEDAPSEGRRGRRRGRKKRGKAAKASAGGTRRGRRAGAASGGVDPVSRFSASALRKVSVLGDRPTQMVSNLADQSVRKRGTAVLGLLLSLFGVALIALVGLLMYLLMSDSPIGSSGGEPQLVEPEPGHSTLIPTVYQGAAEEQEIFDPIAQRPADSAPLDAGEVFGADAEKLELDDFSMALDASEATDTCSAWVWGDDLGQSLVDGGCTSAARGTYFDSDQEYVAQFTLFDLADADASAATAEVLDPRNSEVAPGFVLPMNEEIDGLRTGHSQASTQVMGHYLAVFWVARADGGQPDEDSTMAQVNVVAMNSAVWVYEQVGRAKSEEGE